ncbi:hypothetical protein F0U61_39965 [Archangium violaceum]|uniref:hypothetical protein n=1 Tax=Archangium violaceum TaxID=83451 RepID=UPI002B2EC35F|nr:hypothetical protein F0U61_39965 [Archangium violaceum]
MATVTEGGIQGSSFTSTGSNIGASDVSAQSADTGFAAQGKEQVKRFTGVTRDRVYHQVDSRKDELVKGLQGFISTLENASQNADGMSQQVLHGAVGYIRKFSDRIENGTTEELMQDARQFVREKPAPFFAGCIALGFLAARILKE